MKHKNALDQLLIRRLRDAGCPTPEDCEDDPMPGLEIVVSRPEITRIYVMPGFAEYVVPLQITNRSYNCLEVRKFECDSYWPTRLIAPRGPQIYGLEQPSYRLPGSGRVFSYDSVLNNRTGQAGRISPGDSREGILLAFRRQRLPQEALIPVVPVDVCLVDQNGREHVSQIAVEVDRTAITEPLKRATYHGSGLYGPSESQARVAEIERELTWTEAMGMKVDRRTSSTK